MPQKIGTLRLALTFAGCFLGAGYVSGQELWQYFGAFGARGLLGLVLAVALLGGAAFTGGKGSIFGTILASLFMVVMSSLIAVLNMDAGDQNIIQGVIILVGLLLSGMKKDD